MAVLLKPRRRTRRERLALGVFLGLLCASALSLGGYYIGLRRPGFAQWVTETISAPLRAALGRLSALTSLCLMEVCYVLAGAGLLAFLGFSVARLFRGQKRLRTLLWRLGILLLAALTLWGGYAWLWGVEYQAPGFQEESGLWARPVSAEELERTARLFLQEANALAKEMPRDGEGHFALTAEELLSRWEGVYDALETEFPCLEGESRKPKAMAFSRFVSRLGFTGFYFALTGESCLNMDAPACLLGQVTAHELAHQRGIPNEAECNFLGIAACVTCDDPAYRYAGYLDGLIHLMNALAGTDAEAWRTLRAAFSPELDTDWRDNSAYWNAMETRLTSVSESVYDAYLKSNGDELGIRSYGACVDLLTVYFLPAA